MSVDEPHIELLGISVKDLRVDELDDQPFGVIRLDCAGRILSYNAYEEQLARRRREDVLGKSFFFDVAPCTRVRAFYGRFLEGVEQRSLNARFEFVFDFPHGRRRVDISMVFEPGESVTWVIVRG
ncbi:MAG: PAS domain-containing protein [Myxococcota bacterium]